MAKKDEAKTLPEEPALATVLSPAEVEAYMRKMRVALFAGNAKVNTKELTEQILSEIAEVKHKKEDSIVVEAVLATINQLKDRGIGYGKFAFTIEDGTVARVVPTASTTKGKRKVSKFGIDLHYGKEFAGSYQNGETACQHLKYDAGSNAIRTLETHGFRVTPRTEPIPAPVSDKAS